MQRGDEHGRVQACLFYGRMGMASQTDTPYLLTGGWSSSGEAVDAGVQYSPVNDWYTPFMRLQGGSQMDAQGSIPCWNGLYYTGPNSGQVNSNIGWGQTSLIVISSTQLSQNVDQCQADPNNTAIEDCYSWNQILDVPHNAGWTTKGTGVVWKRATAIAQSTGCPCDDGSTFGYTTSNTTMFYWKNWTLASGGTSTPWVSYNYLNNPDDPTRVFVNFQDAADEYDGLDLY